MTKKNRSDLQNMLPRTEKIYYLTKKPPKTNPEKTTYKLTSLSKTGQGVHGSIY